MIISYYNTKEEHIELNKFIYKNKIGKFNKLFYIYRYFRYFLIIYCVYFVIYSYINTRNFNYITKGIPISLFLGILGYLVIDNALGMKLSKAVNKSIEQNPHSIEEKKLELTESYIRIFKGSIENRVYLKDLLSVVENKYNLYMFFKESNQIIVIPYSAFNNENDQNLFLKIVR